MKRVLIIVGIFILGSLLGIPMWVFRGFSGAGAEIRDGEPTVRILNTQTGKIMNLSLEKYLVGVVAAEMPAEFEPEALKAQAVAARTYTVKRMFEFGAKPSDLHKGAEICTDPTHCQAWCDDEELKRRWGRLKYYIYIEKISKAVNFTKGQVITYNKTIIEPVYHGSCGGRGTENSEDVWSVAIPYLRSVDCVNEYKVTEQVYTLEIKEPSLLKVLKAVGLESTPALAENKSLVLPTKRSPRGRLQEVTILGRRVSGTVLRQTLGLTSTLVKWEASGGKIRFQSIGKGHAVGLCQYGANGMALAGLDCNAIISHYYTGVQIQKLKY